MEKNKPIFDSYNILNLEQMNEFPYCFLGLVFLQNSSKKKAVGLIIG